VLTKVDRIQDGDHEQWLSLVQNKVEPLANNWFCVKQRSPRELEKGITWEEATKSEDRFFSTKSPWKELQPMYQKYLRTTNLVTRLTNLLSDLIDRR
jgi:hypothetical protein